ncbi:sensor histidine kinase [Agromyces atrinae]|nr:histidine kinase [Agromyces atrinae]NYD67326.1 signal transduction histidine kinase [Agromyces atrinae]
MPAANEHETSRHDSLADRRRIAATIAEFVALALLLVIDFEVGSRVLIAQPGTEFIAGALATAIVAIVVAVLVLARRRLPTRVTVTAVFAVSLAASVVSGLVGSPALSLTETAALAVITVFGVRESSVRGSVVIGACALVVALAAVLLRVGLDTTVILTALLLWACAIAGGVAGRYLLRRRESAMDAARREERMELARELHDVVAHQVTGIVVQAQAAIAVAHTDPSRVSEALSTIESVGTEALAGMRRMVGAIRDDADRGAPLTVRYDLGDIPSLIDRFDPGRERTTLRFDTAGVTLPPGTGESAYRVVREALTNVRRHAPEGVTRVTVRVIDSDLVLEIGNDGVRTRSGEPGARGFGLTGMAERVAALGGRMRAGADEPGSWNVWVALPLEVTR